MQYRTGTVAVTNGSTAVVGTGTAWLTNAAVADLITIQGSGIWYQIASITDDTHIVLTAAYQATNGTGLAYVVTREYTINYGFPLLNPGDVETASIMSRALTEIDLLLSSINAVNLPMVVGNGGTGRATAADKALVLGRGANAMASMPDLVTGDLIVGKTGLDPQILGSGSNG